jgi:hypothetical protein
MKKPGTGDPALIRSLVDRVIDELGPGASREEVRQTAALVLGEIGPGSFPAALAPVILVDQPSASDSAGGMSAVRERLSGETRLDVWIRSSVDLPAREPRSVAESVLDSLRAQAERAGSGAAGRICLAVGPGSSTMPLDWIPGLLERDSRLRLAVACARPGLGVDRHLLDRLLRVRSDSPPALAERLFAGCMRLPLGRTGRPRIEILLPWAAVQAEEPAAAVQTSPGITDIRAALAGVAEVTPMILVSARASSADWSALRSWRSRFGSPPGAVDGLRVEGFPAAGVRPFGDTPLCTSPGQAATHLASLACGGAVAPLCLSRTGPSGNGAPS